MKTRLLATFILAVVLTLLMIWGVAAREPEPLKPSQAPESLKSQSNDEVNVVSGFPSTVALPPDRAHISAVLRNAPLMFIENVGQFDERARFQVRGGDATFYLADDALWIVILEQRSEEAKEVERDAPPNLLVPAPQIEKRIALKLSFVGANLHPILEPFDRLETSVNYFIGNDPDRWHAGAPVWGGVRYMDLYPGIDLEITSQNGQLMQRLVVRDGGMASQLASVRLCVDGADALTLDGNRLRLSTALGDFTLPLLQAVSTDGTSVILPTVHPTIRGTEITAPFALSPHFLASASSAEVADLSYSTFLGGSYSDEGYAITVDGAGNAYITGIAPSGFPTTPGAFDISNNGGWDAFVTKVNIDGTGLAYSTFLGGSDTDEAGYGIAVDEAGSAYVTGFTESSDFPTTTLAFDTSLDGPRDAFVVKVNAEGTGLAYSTFLGGSDEDAAWSIVVDEAGSAYVTGDTKSSDFPTTTLAFDTSLDGTRDAFVVKLNASGTGLGYATFVGGSDFDKGYSIAVDEAGSTYVTGFTYSSDFPTTTLAFDTSYNGGGNDAFVVKLNASGTGLGYATFVGGSTTEYGRAIAVDEVGNAYVVGSTRSSDFPTTTSAFDTNYNGGFNDAFVVKVNAEGTGLAYATFLGGNDEDYGRAIAVDEAGSAYVAGSTVSSDFPTTTVAFDTSHNGRNDAFVVKVDANGTGLGYATFLGGSRGDYGHAIAVDEVGNAYVAGETWSTTFPTTEGAFDTSHGGGACGIPPNTYPCADVFVAKFVFYEPPHAVFSASPVSGTAPLTVVFTNTSTGDYITSTWDFGDEVTSTLKSPSHIYTVAGVYTVSLTVSGPGGIDTLTRTNYITAYEPVDADFTGSPSSGVAPLTVDFTNLSTGDYDTCAWTFGDSGTSSDCNDPSHEYTSAGVYTASLTVSGMGGTDTLTRTNYITAYVPVDADFTGNPTSGIAPLTVIFTNTSTGDYTTSLWDFGDGVTSTLESPTHIYSAAGVYTVSLIVSGPGGMDTLTRTNYITAYAPVSADFTGNPTSGIAPLTVVFTNTSTGDYTTSLWDFGDGVTSTLESPTHIYSAIGPYTVTLTVSGLGGNDTEVKTEYITVQYGVYLPLVVRDD